MPFGVHPMHSEPAYLRLAYLTVRLTTPELVAG